MPYPPVDHHNGHQNYGYVRIKDDAEVSGQIQETEDYPELATFLMIVNSPGSPIESVGCEKGFFPGDIEGDPYIDAYIAAAGIAEDKGGPLFRTTGRFTGTPRGAAGRLPDDSAARARQASKLALAIILCAQPASPIT